MVAYLEKTLANLRSQLKKRQKENEAIDLTKTKLFEEMSVEEKQVLITKLESRVGVRAPEQRPGFLKKRE